MKTPGQFCVQINSRMANGSNLANPAVVLANSGGRQCIGYLSFNSGI